MRDDTKNWQPPIKPDATAKAKGVRIRRLALDRQVLVSGTRVQSEFGPCIGWPDIAQGTRYCLSLRRDRVLLVNQDDVVPDGWHADTGHAISDVTGAYMAFEIKGARALELLSRGAELHEPSRSVARLFFGLGAFLYRHKDADCYRVHVARANGQALWRNLSACLE